MIKYIAFNLPSVFEMDESSFLSETDIPAKEFRTWKDDFDTLDEEIEEKISDLLKEKFGFSAIMYAFAKPFEICGFTIVDDDSTPTESLSIIHERLKTLVLLITEDGFELGADQNGISFPGIYDFSEWKLVRDILLQCEASANGNVDVYVQKWAEALPKDN